MARDSSGTKNEPQYAGTGAPSTGADLTELGAYAALVGNRKALTNAQRLALAGVDRWAGLEVYETDTKLSYTYDGGAWLWSGGTVQGVARSTSSQGIADSANTLLTFASADVAAGGISFGSNGFTVAAAGEYEVWGYCVFDADADGRREALIFVNGVATATPALFDRAIASSSTSRMPLQTGGPIVLAASDIVTLRVLHTAGNSINVTDRYLSLKRVS